MYQVTCSSTGKLIIEWFYIDGNIKYDDDWSRPVGYNRQQQQKRITTAVIGYFSHSLSAS
ncbi:hypothetical protein [Cedecea sp.]|uniref:hypothetical protein n=1 Tax=Cedecea sp. TaxID=1970739 RepID=UPI002F3E923B